METRATIVLPVYNEEKQIVQHTQRLVRWIGATPWVGSTIVIADNGSTDATPELGLGLARSFETVRYRRTEAAGRGGALRDAWSSASDPVVAYTDINLSTTLAGMMEILECVGSGAADIAIGSRLIEGAIVTRSLRREVISRVYNATVRALLGVPFRDAQCGCKAVKREVAMGLLDEVEDNGWFFDTELLVNAHRGGFTVREIPVRWSDDDDSRVKIVQTVFRDLCGIMRMRRNGLVPKCRPKK